jgi:hypothetical protein
MKKNCVWVIEVKYKNIKNWIPIDFELTKKRALFANRKYSSLNALHLFRVKKYVAED